MGTSKSSPIPSRVYLDHNATAPLAPFLAESIQGWLSSWGNPSSIHWAGRTPKSLVRDARRSLAHLISCDPLEIVFTSGGSEANNLALKGVWAKRPSSRNEIIVSSVEHPSVLQTARSLKRLGAIVHEIPVNRSGQLDMEFYGQVLSERTLLVSVMFANNETGHIFPIKKLAELAHRVGALFHTDGVQALGKTHVNLKSWGVDLCTFAAHKFYALKGVGLLFVRRGLEIESLVTGGGQERGRRAGTENVLGIASFGEVARQGQDLQSKVDEMSRLRDLMEELIAHEISGVLVTGSESPRICNTSSMVIEGIDGETLLMNLDLDGFAVSTGAACSAGSPEPSPVLLAMGLSRREAQSSLRVSVGWWTTEDEIRQFVQSLKRVVERLRSFHHGMEAQYGLHA